MMHGFHAKPLVIPPLSVGSDNTAYLLHTHDACQNTFLQPRFRALLLCATSESWFR